MQKYDLFAPSDDKRGTIMHLPLRDKRCLDAQHLLHHALIHERPVGECSVSLFRQKGEHCILECLDASNLQINQMIATCRSNWQTWDDIYLERS